MGAREAATTEHETDGGALVKVEVAADVAIAHPHQGRARERAESDPLQDTHGELEAVSPELGVVPRSGGGGDELRDVIQRGLVDPIEDDELGAQVQHLHATASEIHCFGGGRVTALHHERETDVFDPPAWGVHLVDVAILDDSPRQEQLADSWDVTHGLRASVGMHVELHRVSDPFFDKKPGQGPGALLDEGGRLRRGVSARALLEMSPLR